MENTEPADQPAPELLKTEEVLTTPETTPKKSKLTFILLGIFVILLIGAGAFFVSRSLRKPTTTFQPPITPQITKATDETANWKTYSNEKYNFELKYPPSLEVNFTHRGFFSGSDYYGKRDFNILIYDPKIEPSHEGYADDLTGKIHLEYDGYNFAFFSSTTATKHYENFLDLIETGKKSTPPIQEKHIKLLGQKYYLYYQPPSTLPHTDRISYSIISFPLEDSTVIASGNYDKEIFAQILSTFKFLDQTSTDDTVNWKTHLNEEYKFTFKYPENYTFEEMPVATKNYVQVIFNVGQKNGFAFKAEKNYLPNDITYFLDTPSNGKRIIGGNEWLTYLIPASENTEAIYGFQLEKNNILYSLNFPNGIEPTSEQLAVVSTIKFL